MIDRLFTKAILISFKIRSFILRIRIAMLKGKINYLKEENENRKVKMK